ncbi:MAG: NifB/NifX family molybdenum-iron cluster-binding protein [Candidatus Aenigmarchaeota archaeon]|nr:NifB/NifX family molybdenum-iron cluster-binding protein [Candidatus Aenigmarchaeota archaeon]
MRILIPVLENRGKESRVSPHFGRTPYFALYDSETDQLEIIENKSEHFGGFGRPAENMLKYKPDVVFALGMGPRAVNLLRSNNIRIETGDYETVKEIIENKDRLRELEEACKESGHE